MSARIVVSAGPSLGKELWIEDEVLRLGSDPSCELSLAAPDLAGHAATLEYYEGDYLVHNRGRIALWLDDEELAPAGTKVWLPGVTLQLCGSLAVTLAIDGDPAPSRRPRQEVAEEPVEIPDEAFDADADSASTAEGQKKSSFNASQWLRAGAILLVVAVGGGAMFMDPAALKAGAKLSPDADFQAIMADDLDIDRNLREPLQIAWQAKHRGNAKHADHLYRALLEILRRREQAAGQLSGAETSVKEYVGRRLDELK